MKMKNNFYANYGKRWFDFFLTLIGCIFLLPIISIVAIFVRMKIGSPVIFKQVRPGFRGKPFVLYKFRSMTEEKDKNGKLLPDAVRLTALGRIMRATSIDELPELWNVLKGDMSLVGPRPLLMQYLDRYTTEQSRRHEVKSGITGWAQVNGRNCLVFSQRLVLDVWYVDHLSLLLDLKILFLTLKKIMKKEGVIVDQDVREIDDLGLYVDYPTAGNKAKDAEKGGLRND